MATSRNERGASRASHGGGRGSASGQPTFRRVRATGGAAPRTGSTRAAGQRPSPRRAPGRSDGAPRVNRTHYGYPSVSSRLGMQSRRTRGAQRVVGSKLTHNGSLGYITRGPFAGSGHARAARASVAHLLPRIALVAVCVVGLAGLGYAVQGGWNPFAAPTPENLGGISHAVAARIAEPPAQAVRAAQSPDAEVLDAGRVTATGEGRVTFSAVGDNIANENLLELADAAAGTVGDDEYDFTSFYEPLADALGSYDISFINQETTLGGADRYGYNGYPSFNTPDSMAEAIANAGWRVVSLNSNHTYDTWTPSIEHAHEVWDGYRDQLLTIGSYTSADERTRPRVVECNGVRIAFLAYCYGQNGYEQADLPNDYYAVPYVREAMEADVQRARQAADAVVVYMHWGTEYTHEPDDTQRAWAQELADAGVDLVIGSHAHVIQPMEWVEGAGGRTLVVYGLGDVWSGYFDNPECIMSGMFTCTFVKQGSEGGSEGTSEGASEGAAAAAGDASDEAAADEAASASDPRRVSIEDIVWHPVIEHWEDNEDHVYLVEDYTDEQARANELLAGLDDPLGWIQETTQEVIGEEFTIAG